MPVRDAKPGDGSVPAVTGTSDHVPATARTPFDTLPGREVTLTLSGYLPREASPVAESSAAPGDGPPAHPDAWTSDRLRRCSLPMAEPAARAEAAAVRSASDNEERASRGAVPQPRDADDDLFTLVGRATPSPSVDLASEMTERFALGDFSGALRAAELVLGQRPDHSLAAHYQIEARAKLDELYRSRLDARGKVPELLIGEHDVRWLGLDSKVGALLPHINGQRDYEAVIAESGISRLEALRALLDLVEVAVVRLV